MDWRGMLTGWRTILLQVFPYRFVIGLAAMVLIILPLWWGNAALRDAVLEKQRELAAWKKALPELKNQRPKAKPLSGSLFSQMDQAMKAFSAYHPRLESQGDQQVQITVDEVPFDAWLSWMQTLSEQSIQVGDFSFVRKDEGKVGVKITLFVEKSTM